MSYDNESDAIEYSVVRNVEEQYSVWPVGRELPPGWTEAGRRGSKSECLDYIDEVWTDMRPLSLRKAMEARGEGVARPDAAPAPSASPE